MLALLLASLSALATSSSQAGDAPALELLNGRWFDGQRFVERTAYVERGVFVSERPAAVARSLDLAGGFVVPPFAEAHNHNVHDGADAALRRYLAQGVFYVKNPNSLARSTTSIRAAVNRPDSIDAVFAGGGLTGSGGHPVDLVRQNVARGFWSEADGDGGFYFALDDAADLERTWPAIRAQSRDFLKTYLLYSEEYERRRADEAAFGWRGLDPALLPEIVRRAHAEGWRVSTHVETAADFHHALAARVDEVNHMPGFRPLVGPLVRVIGLPEASARPLSAYAIAAEDARAAAAQGTVVVTTLGELVRTLEGVALDAPERAVADEVLELVHANLALLKEHRVRVVLGSDEYDIDESTLRDEFLALARLGVYEPDELLRMACDDTARAIFPARKLGRLEPGYEASFVVLGADPLADPERIKDLRLGVKQGRVLDARR